jgi:hypothetical protein
MRRIRVRLTSANVISTRTAYLPMFAMMNPTAYASWKRPEEGRPPVRQSFFEPWDRR